MATSKIEWTEASWNPLTGCSKISPGCRNCYAERMANRLKAMGSPNYINGFKLSLHESALDIPYKWKTPRVIFVNSMSDLFHEDVPLSFIKKVFTVMKDNPHHTFQVLTKRSKRLKQLASDLEWTDNIWMGVSVENMAYTYRIDNLREVPASVRFLSCEPLLSSLGEIDLKNIHWVIVGGESGPGARPMEKKWVTEIQSTCEEQSVPFFFKQWGGVNKKKTGKLINGEIYQDYPSFA